MSSGILIGRYGRLQQVVFCTSLPPDISGPLHIPSYPQDQAHGIPGWNFPSGNFPYRSVVVSRPCLANRKYTESVLSEEK